jgi:hypothetical protein
MTATYVLELSAAELELLRCALLDFAPGDGRQAQIAEELLARAIELREGA